MRDGMRGIPSGKEEFEDLEPAAELYGLSPRRLHDYLTGKREAEVIGVHYQNSRMVTFDGGGINKVTAAVGPVPDKPTRYIVPGKHAKGVNIDHVSGQVSGKVYHGRFKTFDRRPAQVELWAEDGCSGIIVTMTSDALS